jgi:hypothetical protein
MRGVKIVLLLIMFCIMTSWTVRATFAGSQTLTTAVFITVKALPQSTVAETDENARILNQLAMNQSMMRPEISETKRMEEDVKLSGEKVYTITDRL